MSQPIPQPRSTFTIAQLCLLTMLSGLLCAWLRGTVERSQQVTVLFSSKLSADGRRLINFEEQHGFSVYDTQTGKCLIRRVVQSNRDLVYDENLTMVCIPRFVNHDPLATPSTHFVTVFDVAAGIEREIETPPLDGWRWWLVGIDPDGLIVDLCYLRVAKGESPQPDLVRSWDPRSGKIVHQRLVDGLNVLPMYFLPEGRMFVFGACNVGTAQAEIPILKDPSNPWRDPELKRHLHWFVEWQLDQGGVQRTVVPPQGSFLPRFICLNSKHTKALLSKTPALSGQPHIGESLFLADAPSGDVRNLGFLPFQGLYPGQMTADDKWLIAIENNEFDEQSLLRINLVTMSHEELISPQPHTAPHITDLKLLDGDRCIALATQNGTYRLLDAKTGKDVQPSKHLGFNRAGVMWYIFAVVGAAWVVLWWRTTRGSKGSTLDIGRYAGLMVFVLGLTIGLMLLFSRDEWRKVYYPPLYAALGCAGLGAIVGLVLMFSRRCNKLAAGFALAACAGMAGYIGYLLRTLT